jgi:hypothetical protein
MSALSGSGLSPAALGVSPAALPLGSVVLGQSSGQGSLTYTNSGDVSTPALAVVRGGADPTQFVIDADTCSGIALAAGTTCSVTVRFVPTGAGSRSATVQVSGGAVSATGSATGSGLNTAALVVAANHDFGSVVDGAVSADVTFTVRNTGDVASGTLSTGLGGAAPGQFALGGDGCTGMTLAGGGLATCTIVVHFAPTSMGPHSALLTASASPGGQSSVTLDGTGLLPASISISNMTQSFGAHDVGQTSAPADFVITNDGQVTTGPLTTTRSGADAADFTITADGCNGHTLGAGLSCTISMTFTPSGPGAESALLSVSGAGTVSANLSGTGNPPP